ncbi:MAG: TlyA family RNA methyltransferase [Elusimicrobiota bacterium]
MKKKLRRRLDELLVLRGVFPSRANAKAQLMAGHVRVNGKTETKAGTLTDEDSRINIESPCPYVSRGGLKLAAALAAFNISPASRVCLDVGASTGGFTDCLLQAGAEKVFAIDVGHGQIHSKLLRDPRVVSIERIHAKNAFPDMFFPSPNFAVIDVSFISLTKVLPKIISCLKEPWEILALIKPQFEVGPKLAPKGVVRSPEARESAVKKIRDFAAAMFLRDEGIFESPVHGAQGNIEFFIRLRGVCPPDRNLLI